MTTAATPTQPNRRIGNGFIRIRSNGEPRIVPCVVTRISESGDHVVYFDMNTGEGSGEKRNVKYGTQMGNWHEDLDVLEAAVKLERSPQPISD